jgi:hypothetical protein
MLPRTHVFCGEAILQLECTNNFRFPLFKTLLIFMLQIVYFVNFQGIRATKNKIFVSVSIRLLLKVKMKENSSQRLIVSFTKHFF